MPSPKDVLVHHIGEPRKLTCYADILTYYRALAEASPRVKVVPVGRSNEGRELVVVFVGSEESIGHRRLVLPLRHRHAGMIRERLCNVE